MNLKAYLAQERLPLVLGIFVLKSFLVAPSEAKNQSADYVYEPVKDDKPVGLHAVTLVGYDSNRRAFRIVNSWGTHWGDRGFLWIHEDYFRVLLQLAAKEPKVFCALAVRPAGPIALGAGPATLLITKEKLREGVSSQ